MTEACGSCGQDRALSAPPRCESKDAHQTVSPKLSQPDRATARKALWDLRAEVTRAMDDVVVRRATYGSLYTGLAAMEARIAQLRLALGSAEAGKPVSGPLRAARGYPADDPGLNMPPGVAVPRVGDSRTWPTDSQGNPVPPPWDLGDLGGALQ